MSEDTFTVEVVTSFDSFRAKATYEVGAEFLRRYGKYVKVLAEPEPAEEPKPKARKPRKAVNGDPGGDLQEEG